jgi:thiol-disulfide isomerase/thioredoxin
VEDDVRRVVLAVAAMLLAGCTGSHGKAAPTSGDTLFVAGSGAVTLIPPDKRGTPVALSGELVDGASYDVAAHRGTVFLLNVWGSWCAPCRREAPDLARAWASEQSNGDVQFLGLNTREDATAAAVAFERRFGITYPSLRDPDGRLQLTFRTTLPPKAIPSTLVLDRQGRVAARIVGVGSELTFTELIDQVRAER